MLKCCERETRPSNDAAGVEGAQDFRRSWVSRGETVRCCGETLLTQLLVCSGKRLEHRLVNICTKREGTDDLE